MSILFYSDPHFGLARRENFTERSLAAREADCLAYLNGLVAQHQPVTVVCLGDLFDKANNHERVIMTGAAALSVTDLVLAGNHDVINREGAVSSLHVLKEIGGDKVVLENWGPNLNDAVLWLIPHCKTQTEFMGTLNQALGWPGGLPPRLKEKPQILCLHCNFDSSFADKEQELSLSREMAERLLQMFDFILIGHEHAAADYFDGRLKIVSSLFPTSFGDAGAVHRALLFEDGQFKDLPTPANYFKGSSSRLCFESIQAEFDPKGGFFDLIDDLPTGEAARMAVELFDLGAYAVKIRSQQAAAFEPTEVRQVKSLPATISDFLRENEADLVWLWDEFTKESKP